MNAGCEPVVVRVGMRDDQRDERLVASFEARHRRQGHDLILSSGEGPTEIEHKSFSLGLQLGTASADLVRPPVNLRSHRAHYDGAV